jgi:hypothetical protein
MAGLVTAPGGLLARHSYEAPSLPNHSFAAAQHQNQEAIFASAEIADV